MIDTGDWMTAREIPNDFAFLEKPPLKFWMVGLPIRLGLLPRTEFGFRAVDVLLGAIAFGYVALFGYRLAGPVGGDRLVPHPVRPAPAGARARHPQQQHGGRAAGGVLRRPLPLPALAARRRAARRDRHRRLVHARLPDQVRGRRVPAAGRPDQPGAAAARPAAQAAPRLRRRLAVGRGAVRRGLGALVRVPVLAVRRQADRDDVPAARLRAVHRRARSDSPAAVGPLLPRHRPDAGRGPLRVAGRRGRRAAPLPCPAGPRRPGLDAGGLGRRAARAHLGAVLEGHPLHLSVPAAARARRRSGAGGADLDVQGPDRSPRGPPRRRPSARAARVPVAAGGAPRLPGDRRAGHPHRRDRARRGQHEGGDRRRRPAQLVGDPAARRRRRGVRAGPGLAARAHLGAGRAPAAAAAERRPRHAGRGQPYGAPAADAA